MCQGWCFAHDTAIKLHMQEKREQANKSARARSNSGYHRWSLSANRSIAFTLRG